MGLGSDLTRVEFPTAGDPAAAFLAQLWVTGRVAAGSSGQPMSGNERTQAAEHVTITSAGGSLS